MSVRTSDYDFNLPDELIARHPAARRDQSRMLVLHRDSEKIEHRTFSDLPEYLTPNDLAVLNDTKVLPARVFSDGGAIELLVFDPRPDGFWQCLVKPGRKMRVGKTVTVGGCTGEVVAVAEDGSRTIRFDPLPDLERIGKIPLPPYLGREVEETDRERYQTVYAAAPGAVAAPTAGLHFTPEILAKIPHVLLTLHVGAGTFKPVQTEDLTGHLMHAERFELSTSTAAKINAAKSIFAVGTTTVRVLESCAVNGEVCAQTGETRIFIHPPYRFQIVDKLLTNFHLPKSTLLMLVSAFATREQILAAYHEAVAENYRFYSYGDCMLIL
ncbi:MAG TPA: tRNA preQ1(34) S-adenosylmethionine ribosyltransferase-isomerase QueA [Chthoniobacterales bacterium]